jgi:anti-sigma regulatory factor (Ser/Thr protein kinase)
MIGLRAARGRRSLVPFADTFAFTVSGGPHAPGAARLELDGVLEGTADGGTAGSCRLLLSEVVTNCVVHGGATASDEIDVAGAISSETIRIAVTGVGAPFEHEPAPVSVDAPGGRGLVLVGAVADRWGTRNRDGRAEVWFEVSVPG